MDVYALRLSRAIRSVEPSDNFIDHGWSILKALHNEGFDVTPRRVALVCSGRHEGRSLNEMAGLDRGVGKPGDHQ